MFRLTSLHLGLIAAVSLSACGGNVPTMETHRRVVGRNSTTMPVYPIGTVTLQSAGVWKEFNHLTTTVLDPTAMTGGLSPSTRYWLYAIDDAGAIGFEVSTTGPEEGLRYMQGDSSRFYVSMFCTTSLGNLMPYAQTDNEYTLAAANVLLNGNAMVTTPIPVTSCVPPQATRLRYLATVNATLAGRYASLTDSGGLESVRLVDNGTISWSMYGDFGLTPNPDTGYKGAFSYVVSNATTELTVDLTGFTL